MQYRIVATVALSRCRRFVSIVPLYRFLDKIPWVRESLPRKPGILLFIATQLTLLLYVFAKDAVSSPTEPDILLLIASFNRGSWVDAYVMMRFFLRPTEAAAPALRA